MQLKEEIAKGYFEAGNKAYRNKKYNTAVANWKEAKNWGYDQNDVAMNIKTAEAAKMRAAQAAKAQSKNQSAVSAPVEQQEVPVPIPEPISTNNLNGEDTSKPITPPGINPEGANTEFPTATLTQQPGMISEDARQASNERYLIGAKYYADGDYERAKSEFQAALQLNPENSDAALGLKNIEAKLSSR